MTVQQFIQTVADRLGLTYEEALGVSLPTAALVFNGREVVDTTGELLADEDELSAPSRD